MHVHIQWWTRVCSMSCVNHLSHLLYLDCATLLRDLHIDLILIESSPTFFSSQTGLIFTRSSQRCRRVFLVIFHAVTLRVHFHFVRTSRNLNKTWNETAEVTQSSSLLPLLLCSSFSSILYTKKRGPRFPSCIKVTVPGILSPGHSMF